MVKPGFIYSKITGMGVEYFTDQPGIQFYTGNMMKDLQMVNITELTVYTMECV